MYSEIGRLERVHVRELWRSEPYGFTAWLAENIEVLSEVLGTQLTVTAREEAVGSFFLDLLAENEDGDTVVIENQLDRTDHDHLGKLLTYLSNLEAKMAIWISTDPRPEHVAAVSWLNEFTPDDVAFIVVKVEAVKIGNSPPAVNFIVVAQPTSDAREIGKKKKEEAERHVLRRQFWEQLLERAKQSGVTLHANVSPSRDHWLSATRKGIQYNYLILKDKAAVELYIDRGNAEENKAIFDQLMAQNQALEQEIGGELVWHRADKSRASSIRHFVEGKGLYDTDGWAEMQGNLIAAMKRFSAAFMKRLE